MGIIQLDRHFVGQGLPVIATAAEARDDIRQRAGDQEILLGESQISAALVGAEASWSPRTRYLLWLVGREMLDDSQVPVLA
jgi:hypothetical protein